MQQLTSKAWNLVAALQILPGRGLCSVRILHDPSQSALPRGSGARVGETKYQGYIEDGNDVIRSWYNREWAVFEDIEPSGISSREAS